MSFVHLHVHSEFSLGTSLLRCTDLARKVREYEMPAVALTDWGNLYGSLHFLKAIKKYGEGKVKPIFGAELGVKIPNMGPFKRHLVLLAQNQKGYENLRYLVSRAHTDHGYSVEEGLQPYQEWSEILKHNEGLILLTGGLKGLLNSFLLQDQEKVSLELLKEMKEAYKGRCYLELQHSGMSVLDETQLKLQEWSESYKIPTVATADVHYLQPEDSFAHEVWMMVSQKTTLESNPRSGLISQEFYLKSPNEMRLHFNNNPEALENTLKIADQCSVDFNFKDSEGRRIYYLPTFEEKGKDQETLFREYCFEGLEQRFQSDRVPEEEKETYKKRLEYEISVISNMGFSGYYLIVSDFIRWAKNHEIPVGPGRGSGAGSLAAYCLDIIDLNPIENKLVFERFLNPERVSLPDFDIDFCQARRHEVIEYVSQKYGSDHVCQIVTFAKEQSKNAIKDVGRVLGMSFGETNRLSKSIPSVMAKPLTLEEAMEEVDELKTAYDQDPKTKQVIDLALKVEGGLRQPGVHAAGVIIASEAVEKLAPVSRDVNGNPITQWDMKMSEEAGLVKFDFLGLVTLDLLDLACRLISQRAQEQGLEDPGLKYDSIPIHDPQIYKLISEGDTLGVFQLESGGMQNLCKRIKPDCFDDISAINALFRPGPLESGMVDDFVNRKHGRAAVEVLFPEMKEILNETYGVILYQEQVMELARVISGYTLGGADLLRRAMGKKIFEEMEAQREIFVSGAEKNKKDPQTASELFDLIAKFAGYGFNKSHAAAYAKLAVQTAYLKALYPDEFFTALLTIEKENNEKLARYIGDAKKRNLRVLPPDINESHSDFSIVKKGIIRFGLSAIKNVGEAAVESMMEARKKDGPFKDIFDFCLRVDQRKINKRVLESLIQAGAFDKIDSTLSTAEARGRYLASVESILEWSAKETASKASGQFSLFGDEGPGAGADDMKPRFVSAENPTEREMLEWEKQLLGLYLTGSPLDKYQEKIAKLSCVPLYRLKEKAPKSIVWVAGMVSDFKELRIKRGRRIGEMMAVFRVEDEAGHVEMVSFPDHYKEFQELIKGSEPLIFRAELDFEEDKPKLLGGQVTIKGAMAVERLDEIAEEMPDKLSVSLNLDKLQSSMSPDFVFQELLKLLKKYPGAVPVELHIKQSGRFHTTLKVPEENAVMPQKNLLAELSSLLSIPNCIHGEWR